uniref:Reverse transcriptase zinc-binding domain-containing protein n=1 Tax=Aegilops tauschii TaxID=37682 RepID=M8C7Z5_AEGTA
MKLKINKACDLASISVLPPRRTRGSSGGGMSAPAAASAAPQQRSQSMSQKSFSQDGGGGTSAPSDASAAQQQRCDLHSLSIGDQRFAMKEDPSKRMSSYPASSASSCQVNEDVERKFQHLASSVQKMGMILDSVQNDVMQLNRGMKEASLDSGGIQNKFVILEDSLKQILKGQDDLKALLKGSTKSSPDQLSILTSKMDKISSILSVLPKQVQTEFEQFKGDIFRIFTKEMEDQSCTTNAKPLMNQTAVENGSPLMNQGPVADRRPQKKPTAIANGRPKRKNQTAAANGRPQRKNQPAGANGRPQRKKPTETAANAKPQRYLTRVANGRPQVKQTEAADGRSQTNQKPEANGKALIPLASQGWNLAFRRSLSPVEFEDWQRLTALFPTLSTVRDSVLWPLSASGRFSVKSLYSKLVGGTPTSRFSQVWKARIPPKIKIFLWQAFRGRLPSADQIRKRNGPGSQFCALCGEACLSVGASVPAAPVVYQRKAVDLEPKLEHRMVQKLAGPSYSRPAPPKEQELAIQKVNTEAPINKAMLGILMDSDDDDDTEGGDSDWSASCVILKLEAGREGDEVVPEEATSEGEGEALEILRRARKRRRREANANAIVLVQDQC